MKRSSIFSVVAALALLAPTATSHGQNILYEEDFEGGSNGQLLTAAPYSWTKINLPPLAESFAIVTSLNPIGDGLGVDGNFHTAAGAGVYTQPAVPAGDGFRLTMDLYASSGANVTENNAIGLGGAGLGTGPGEGSGAFLHLESDRWNLNTTGLNSTHKIKFQNNPRDQVVQGMVEVDMLRNVVTGSITFGGQTEFRSAPDSLGGTREGINASFVPFLDSIRMLFRARDALSVDNILLERLVLDLGWNQDSDETFNSASHWTPRNGGGGVAIVPDTNLSIAHFGAAITSPRTVSIDTPVTLREIEFENTSAYTIGGSSTITLAARPKYTARIEVLSGTQHTISAPIEVDASTIVTVPTGANLTIDGALNMNNKFLTKDDDGTLTINGSLPAAGSPVGGAIVVRAGTLAGTGTVDSYLNNIGSTVAPGDNGPGTLTVSGHYAQGAKERDLPILEPSLALDINGLTAGSQHDVLDVVGNLSIFGGSLDITVGGGFVPTLGQSFDVLDFGTARGAFDTINGTPGAGLAWDTSQILIDGTLSVVTALAAASEQVPEPTTGCLAAILGILGLHGFRRKTLAPLPTRRTLRPTPHTPHPTSHTPRRTPFSLLLPTVVALLLASPSAQAQTLDRGHRVLVERGIQLQAITRPTQNGAFDLALWQSSNFTTIDFQLTPYPTALQVTNSPSLADLDGLPWTRDMDAQEFYLDHDLFAHELAHVDDLVRFQVKDEQDLTDPEEIAYTVDVFDFLRDKYPDVLLNVDVGMSVLEMQNFMQQARPHLLMNQSYHFFGDVSPGGGNAWPGGSPTDLYRDMAIFREAALLGNDGTGTTPIPYGMFTQMFVRGGPGGHAASDSETRHQNFAAWAFGYTLIDAFVYETDNPNPGVVEAILFNGVGTGSPTPLFAQVAETNRQSQNIGPGLVRLVSTDARMIMGRHMDGVPTTNTLAPGVATWDAAADPFITDISATNLGALNDGLEGDVVVGYYEPLHESFTTPGFDDDTYFMIMNGLSLPTGTVAATSQEIRLDFDFGASGITNLLRLSRDTGLVETVNLVSDGGSLYHLDLTLEGGTGDLFKFNNGGAFVSGDFVEWDADFDGSGLVDGADFLTLQRGFGLTSQIDNSNGDADGSGTVDSVDLAIWESQYGTISALSGIAASAAQVPEPASASLLTILATVLIAATRRTHG